MAAAASSCADTSLLDIPHRVCHHCPVPWFAQTLRARLCLCKDCHGLSFRPKPSGQDLFTDPACYHASSIRLHSALGCKGECSRWQALLLVTAMGAAVKSIACHQEFAASVQLVQPFYEEVGLFHARVALPQVPAGLSVVGQQPAQQPFLLNLGCQCLWVARRSNYQAHRQIAEYSSYFGSSGTCS